MSVYRWGERLIAYRIPVQGDQLLEFMISSAC